MDIADAIHQLIHISQTLFRLRTHRVKRHLLPLAEQQVAGMCPFMFKPLDARRRLLVGRQLRRVVARHVERHLERAEIDGDSKRVRPRYILHNLDLGRLLNDCAPIGDDERRKGLDLMEEQSRAFKNRGAVADVVIGVRNDRAGAPDDAGPSMGHVLRERRIV